MNLMTTPPTALKSLPVQKMQQLKTQIFPVISLNKPLRSYWKTLVKDLKKSLQKDTEKNAHLVQTEELQNELKKIIEVEIKANQARMKDLEENIKADFQVNEQTLMKDMIAGLNCS